MVRLEAMTEEECRAFLETLIPEYAQGHVRAGSWKASDADERSRAEVTHMLAQGVHTPDHYLRTIHDDRSGVRVGEVWYALQKQEGWPQLFVYWIGIGEDHRRKGYAQAVFPALEQEAQRLGARRVALHVFGDNTGAIALYEKVGFAPTNVLMAKNVP